MVLQVSKDTNAFGDFKEKSQAAGVTNKYSTITKEEM